MVLELGASAHSYLPTDLPLSRVVGIGVNEVGVWERERRVGGLLVELIVGRREGEGFGLKTKKGNEACALARLLTTQPPHPST